MNKYPEGLNRFYKEINNGGPQDAPRYYFEEGSKWAAAARTVGASLTASAVRLSLPWSADEGKEGLKMQADWRRYATYQMYPQFAPGSLTHVSERQLSVLRPYMDSIRERSLRALRSSPELRGTVAAYTKDATYPVAKGKGAPWYVPGSDRQLGVVIASWANSMSGAAEVISEMKRLSLGRAIGATTYVRTQGNRKPITAYDFVNGTLQPVSEWAGYPKVRKVQGVPMPLNVLSTYGSAALYCIMRVVEPGYMSSLAEVKSSLEAVGVRSVSDVETRVAAEDYSTFDDTVGLQCYLYIIQHVHGPILRACEREGVVPRGSADNYVAVQEYMSEAPIIGPSFSLEDDSAALAYERSGGIISGQRPTSGIGTTMNLAIRGLMASMNPGVCAYHTFSDDTLVVFRRADDLRRYNDSGQAILNGLIAPCSISSGDWPSYLGKYISCRDERVVYAASVARLVGNTLQREENREPRARWQAVVGLTARLRMAAEANELERMTNTLAEAASFSPLINLLTSACLPLATAPSSQSIRALSQIARAGISADRDSATEHTAEDLELVLAEAYGDEGSEEFSRATDVDRRDGPAFVKLMSLPPTSTAELTTALGRAGYLTI